MIIVRKAVAGLSEATMARFVTRAARAGGLRGQANVLLTTNREMQSLNSRFLSKNVATDVLSFPANLELPGQSAGDIAISTEMAAQNGKRLGHSPGEEVKILALHGLLHLAGYDHEHDNGRMARKEQQLRIRLGLPAGLIERNIISARIPDTRPRKSRRAPVTGTTLSKSKASRRER
jgi:probable rRNA maturation factor